MHVLYGDALAETLIYALQERITALDSKPTLAILLVGDDPASKSYIRGKKRACSRVSIESHDDYLPKESSEEDVLAWVEQKNRDPAVHAILVQMPLPAHISEHRIINAIDPRKDVDGFHPLNMGLLMAGRPAVVPCTPLAIKYMLEAAECTISGSKVVILNRSNIVGKPLALLLSAKGTDATVTLCHSRTHNLANFCKEADILISAMGSPECINADMVQDGAVLIDVAINRVPTGNADKPWKLVGDFDFASVSAKASFITPVPKGVGPMTIAMLLENTVSLAEGGIKW